MWKSPFFKLTWPERMAYYLGKITPKKGTQNPQNLGEMWSLGAFYACGDAFVAFPRMARQGEVIPREGSKRRRKLNKCSPHEQTSVFIGTSFSWRARGSNPGPPDIVILQWPLHHQRTAFYNICNSSYGTVKLQTCNCDNSSINVVQVPVTSKKL